MKAYLQQNHGEWYDDFVYISNYPLIRRNYEIIPFDATDIDTCFDNVDVSKDICIGTVEATTKFFEKCGVSVPKCLSYPKQLKSFLGRKIIKTTVKNAGKNFPYFIKPSHDIKLFTGDIIEDISDKDFLVVFDFCKSDTPIYKSEVVNFISEYRIFVANNEIRGIKHYKGDFTKFINIQVINKMIKMYKKCPITYTLDVGLTSDGRTLLVEVNDMWAIGSYGLDGETYTLLCILRMKEILNQWCTK